MASYNTLNLPFCIGTRVKVEAGIDVDRASNGAARGRSLYAADKRTFTLKHAALDATQRGALDTFYQANKTAEVDLTYDSVTYICIFADAPRPEYIGANLADMVVELVEV